MPICGYLVIPSDGACDALAERLTVLPGCDVARARNRDVLVLVTDTAGPSEEAALRARLLATPGIGSLVLTFGDLEPGSSSTAGDR